jgi:hypothetical protein
MTDTASLPATTTARLPNGQFGAGNLGRPQGSRNRVSGRVAVAILEDFEAHQGEILDRLRGGMWLPLYVRLIAGLLPRQVDIALPDITAFSEAEVARRVLAMRDLLDRIQDGDASLLDLEAVLLSEEEGDG